MLNIDDRFLGEATIDQFWFMCHLAKFMNMDATCFPSNQTLCDCTGWRISKLNEVKKSCIDAGFIKVETRYLNNRQSSNEYTVLIDRISIAVNLKGKKARQIPTTNVAPYHAGGTPPATLAAPPPATLAAPEVLISNEVLTNEVSVTHAHAHAENSADLKTEDQTLSKRPGAPAVLSPGWNDFPKADTPDQLKAELSRFYQARPEDWKMTKEATPAQTWAADQTAAVVARFCDWAIGEGWERRTFKQINARLKRWFKEEPLMRPAATITPRHTIQPAAQEPRGAAYQPFPKYDY